MAVTNFAHMKPWENSYEELLLFEDDILDADKKQKYTRAMVQARGIIDAMLKEMVVANGIPDDKALAIQRKHSSPEHQNDKSLSIFGRIRVLQEYGYISATSANNLDVIRKHGNKANHKDEPYMKKSMEELKNIAEKEIYPFLYRETYLFANQYIPEAKSRKGARVGTGVSKNGSATVSNYGNKKAAGDVNGSAIIVALIKIFFILLGLAVSIGIIMNMPF